MSSAGKGIPQPSASQDAFEDDNEDFEQALAAEPSPVMARRVQASWGNSGDKRKRDEQDACSETPHLDPYRAILSTSERSRPAQSTAVAEQPSLAADALDSQEYLASEAYKPTAFGDFRTYMQNKRMKLKVQEHSMTADEESALESAQDGTSGTSSAQTRPRLFSNACIYINGHTVPPYAEMRRLIHLHGGELMPYLDQKTPVTHILASNLTAKKRIEFKDYRVVRPEWITQSIAEGRRLDWRDFRCTEDAAGALQPGALDSRAKLQGNRQDVSLENVQGTGGVVPLDWRAKAASMAAAQAEGKAGVVGRTYTGNGVESVGPWGAASRQKSLGSWARIAKGERSEKIDSDAPSKAGEAEERQPDRSEQSEEELHVDVHEPRQESIADTRQYKGPGLPAETPHKAKNKGIPSSKDSWSEEPAAPKAQQNEGPKTPDKGKIQDTLPDKYYSTDPVNPELAALNAWQNFPSHPYASRPSNSKAAQLMASPSWRERNTATGEGFLEGYFGKSRLHHLSTWKSEMREMVGQALREADRAEGSIDLPAGVRRVIMHIDFDAFFVSVGLRARPDLHDKAVVVCHADSDTAGNGSTSEIASCNYIAREHGIRNGMSLGQARRFFAEVATIPYDFKAYNDIAIRFYTLLLAHADAIEAVSIDEALVDVSFLLEEMRQGKTSEEPARKALMGAYNGHLCSQGQQWTEEKQLAEALRDEIRASTGCEASIGIGSNVLLARLATRKAKPGGSFHLQDENTTAFVDELDIDDLHGVGWSIRNRCKELFGTQNVGQLKVLATRSKFVAQFGEKHGVTLWDKLHGRERARLEPVKQRQSCGAAVNYAIRFKSDDEAREFVLKLCQEVSSRLHNIKLVGKVCCVSLMVRSKEAPVEAPKFLGHGWCDTFNRSAPLSRATDDAHVIFENAWRLIAGLHIQPDQMRGIGVSLQKLLPKDGTGFAAKREVGQRALSFKPAAKNNDQSDVVGDAERSEETGAGEADILNSPSAQRSALLQEDDSLPPQNGRTSTIPEQHLSTQYALPPSSQLDHSVVDALPMSLQEQIRKRREAKAGARLEEHMHSSDASSDVERSSSQATSPRTPRKISKTRDLDVFARMRAASTTPSKKGTPKRSQSKLGGHISLPSTPSGSQKRARQMEWEPTWSQVDQEVLAELPDDVREEILRQIGNEAGPSRGPGRTNSPSLYDDDDSPTKHASKAILEQKGLIGITNRSHSESPRKRQAYLDVPGFRSRMAQPSTNAKNSNHLPPLLPRANLIVKADSTRAPDPATVTSDELVALDIDPDVFTALPLSMQRETLEQQSALAAERKARFKSGRQVIGVTLAQQRLQLRQSAMANTAPGVGEFRAMRQEEGKTPSLKGCSNIDEVRGILSSWFAQFRKAGPRERDVQRIASFFVESIEAHHESRTKQYSAPLTRARTRAESAPIDIFSATLSFPQAQSLEKVQDLLLWWSRLHSSTQWKPHEEASRKSWNAALQNVKTQVDAATTARYGARISLGPSSRV